MGSDISRSTFDPNKRYSGVRQQQGRVNLDADWNEQADIAAHRVATGTADVIGPGGAPRDNAGFQIQGSGTWVAATFFPVGAEIFDANGNVEIAITAGISGTSEPAWPTTMGATVADGPILNWQLVESDLSISPGRIYVDGLLCELTATTVPIENFTGDGTGASGTQVQVSPTLVDALQFQAGQWVEISATGNQAPAPLLVQITVVNAAAGSLTFALPVSSFGSPNMNPQLQRFPTYLTQPDYPSAPALPGSGTSIVYLDVWERAITAIEDPQILEIALGGPDTTTRTKMVSQVKLVDVSSVPGVTCSTADSAIPTWEHAIQPSAAQLTTGVGQSATSGPCCLTPSTGYTGMENQFYRVQIHAAGVYGWRANTPYGLWAEVIDLNGNLEIAIVAGTSGQTPPAWPTTFGATTFPADGTITWQLAATGYRSLWAANTAYAGGAQVVDSNGNVETAVATGTSGSAAPAWPAGRGVPVNDGTGGLMWQYATPTFKWSRDNSSVATAVTGIANGTNTAGTPASQLTVESLGRDQVLGFTPGNWVEVTDDWQELAGQSGELHQIDSIDSTGKTITLDSLVSAVSFPTVTGQTGPNRHTRLTRWDQSGKVYASDGATIWVDLGAAGSTGDIPVPPLGTALILENGITVSFGSNPVNGPIYAGDFWNFAARTAYGSVELLTQAYPHGIQHHYCRLGIINFGGTPWILQDCRLLFPPLADAGVHVTGVFLSSGLPLWNDGTIAIQTDLVNGINVVCDTPLDPATITQPNSSLPTTTSSGSGILGAQATCFVTVGVPLLNEGSVVGFNPLILPAKVGPDPTQTIIQWAPVTTAVTEWLATQVSSSCPSLLAHLTLTGNFIWAQGNPNIYLQGNVLGTPYTGAANIQQTGLQLPSGSARRGSDFHMWFWLISVPPVTLSATSLDFGNQLVGAPSATQSVTLTNHSATAVSIALVGTDSGDFAENDTCASVPVGANCTINVTFTPTQVGARLGQININAGGGAPSPLAVITLLGTGIQPSLAVSPGSLAFGNVNVGATSAPRTVTITNTGPVPLAVTSITITGTSFSQTNTCAAGTSSLAPGGTCIISVRFFPTTSGLFTGSITITSNAPGAPSTIPLSGTGTEKFKEILKDTKDVRDTTKGGGLKDKITPERLPSVSVSTGPVRADTEVQGTRRAFIQPQERPPVGRQALGKSDEGLT